MRDVATMEAALLGPVTSKNISLCVRNYRFIFRYKKLA
jgi:hypothetical protein